MQREEELRQPKLEAVEVAALLNQLRAFGFYTSNGTKLLFSLPE